MIEVGRQQEVHTLDHVDNYLMIGKESDASDIHLSVNSQPIWRRFGNLEPIWRQAPVLTPEEAAAAAAAPAEAGAVADEKVKEKSAPGAAPGKTAQAAPAQKPEKK